MKIVPLIRKLILIPQFSINSFRLQNGTAKSIWLFFFVVIGLGVFRASAATVTTLADNGPGSLRAAVAVGGVVNFNVTGVITLTSGELLINSPVSIGGPVADRLTIQRSDAPETPEFRVFEIRSAIASIYGLTIRNGYLSNSPDEYGAGIL